MHTLMMTIFGATTPFYQQNLGYLAVPALILALLGAFAIVLQAIRHFSAKKVPIKVIGLHPVNPKKTSSKSGVTYRMEFEVVSGPHAGTKGMSSVERERPAHAVGDEFSGYLIPQGGKPANIETPRTIRAGYYLGLGCLAASIVLFLFTQFVVTRMG